MIRLSNKAEYGIRALIRLSMKGNLTTRELAFMEFIPERFLEHIMKDFKDAGIVIGKRGPKGGYVLAKKPSEITLGDIIKALEGKTAIVKCLDDENACSLVAFCVMRSFWRKVQDQLEKAFYSITLQDILDDIKNERLLTDS